MTFASLPFSSLAREQLGLRGRELLGRQHTLVLQALELRQLLGDVGGAAAWRCGHRRLGVLLLCLLRLELLQAHLLVFFPVVAALRMLPHRVRRSTDHCSPHQRTSPYEHGPASFPVWCRKGCGRAG